MKLKSDRKRNFSAVFSLTILTVWLVLPQALHRMVEPTALAAATTFTVNVTGDGHDANPGDGTCATASGNCSLRAAIEEANANTGKDTIDFNIPGAGVHTITPNSALPKITAPVVIDGYSQPGASPNTLSNRDDAVLLIELNGANANDDGLVIGAGNSTVKGLVINRFVSGIGLTTNGGNKIEGNFIGTNAPGTSALGNKFSGVYVAPGSDNNVIGGTSAAARNIISGNGGAMGAVTAGVYISGPSNTVEFNFIGTDAHGTGPLGNVGIGLRLYGIGNDNNLIKLNVISANSRYGIEITQTSNTVVQSNFIGTDSDGLVRLGNSLSGVHIYPGVDVSNNNLIGGTVPGAGNVISGNGEHGVLIDGAVSNKVQGNIIGLNKSGTQPLSNNLSGVFLNDFSQNNLIGGVPGAGNIIAFNGDHGVSVTGFTGNAIATNSIFSNGDLGIDLNADGVTANDFSDSDSGPNNLQNSPDILSASTDGTHTEIQGTLDSSPNTDFSVQFFASPSCDPAGSGEGQTYVGSIGMRAGPDGHIMFSTFTLSPVAAGQFITATATDEGDNTSEFSQCVQVVGVSTSNTIHFGQSLYSVFEDCTAVTITVAREGSTASAASVDYATQAGTANERSDFNTAFGTLTFAPGETAKSFDVLISEDSYNEGNESFSVALSNPSGVTLGSPAATTVQIFDDPPEPATNPIDTADDFVCQHYHDFLNREDDSAGLGFWTNNIMSCGNDAACIQRKRIDTSAAFFLSIEFQETGGFAIRVQRSAFAKKSVEPASRISYTQFIHDARLVGDGVVVGQPGSDVRLETNRQAYIDWVATSPAFTSRYAAGLTADQFVDALFASAGVTPTATERQNAINAFGGGGTSGRSAALRSVSDSNAVRSAEFSPAFVLMQYYGYLRRNPTDAPDNNDSGYQFWLTKLNNFSGDYQRAEMVKAFITSTEYRKRFGP